MSLSHFFRVEIGRGEAKGRGKGERREGDGRGGEEMGGGSGKGVERGRKEVETRKAYPVCTVLDDALLILVYV